MTRGRNPRPRHTPVSRRTAVGTQLGPVRSCSSWASPAPGVLHVLPPRGGGIARSLGILDSALENRRSRACLRDRVATCRLEPCPRNGRCGGRSSNGTARMTACSSPRCARRGSSAGPRARLASPGARTSSSCPIPARRCGRDTGRVSAAALSTGAARRRTGFVCCSSGSSAPQVSASRTRTSARSPSIRLALAGISNRITE